MAVLGLLLLRGGAVSRHPVPRPPSAEGGNLPGESAVERELLALTNQTRERSGAQALKPEECLTQAARQHAAFMAEHGEISHQFAGEPVFNQRMASHCNLPMQEFAENVGEATDAAGAHQAFMHSPAHRTNLLHGSYNAAGFGIVRRGSMLYVVEDFAHIVPSYSGSHAEDLIAKSINNARATVGLPHLQRKESGGPQAEACGLAHADSVKPSAPAKPGQARYILRFTTLQPENLPGGIGKALQDRNVTAFSVGTCFARTPSYSSGAYWVVLELY
jgi:hypothetical protein